MGRGQRSQAWRKVHIRARSTGGRTELKTSQPRINGVQVRMYDGIGLRSYTLNADDPVSPVSEDEHAGQGAAADTGNPVSDLASDQPSFGDTGNPVSTGGVKPQVNHTDTGDTGKSAFKVQHHQAGEAANAAYLNGMCRDCGANPHSPGRPRCDTCHQIWLTSVDGYNR